MQSALKIAKKGRGWTLSNPMVGAVIIKNGQRIGEGYHRAFGEKHAEIEALENCQKSPKGGLMLVTLEPCCNTGKTPPCTDSIIKSGIEEIIIATKDTSKKVNGKGIKILKNAGIKVKLGLLEKEARNLNRIFFTFHEKKRPFITLKAAVSLDGKISYSRHMRTYLTGIETEKFAHFLRHEHEAVLVGAGTVLSDDPHLGVRYFCGRDPIRIILTNQRKLPKKARIFRDQNVLIIKSQSIKELMDTLYKNGITSMLVEGGQTIYKSFLISGFVDEIHLFIAPKVLGESAIPFPKFQMPLSLKAHSVHKFGQDLHLIATIPNRNGLRVGKEV